MCCESSYPTQVNPKKKQMKKKRFSHFTPKPSKDNISNLITKLSIAFRCSERTKSIAEFSLINERHLLV